MTFRLELLPRELLWQVVGYLPTCDAVQLLTCNKRLCYGVKDEVYKRKDAHHKAMKFGCFRDRPDIIRLAASYGASVNTFADLPLYLRNCYSPRIVASTLWLSITYQSFNAVKTLLELGARLEGLESEGCTIPDRDLTGLFYCLLEGLGSPVGDALFRLFVESGLDLQVQRLDTGSRYYTALPALIQAGMPIDLIRTVLDRGADPNGLLPKPDHRDRELSALSAAIKMDNLPVFNLLIERGADINGVDILIGYSPWRIPVFAAAKLLATVGPSKYAPWMRACLAHGADVNQVVRLKYNTTPLHHFMDSVTSWEADGESDPIGGLKLLLNAGATPNGLGRRLTLRHHWYQGGGIEDPQSSCLDLLLRGWDGGRLDKLSATDSKFRATVQLLIDHGAARNDPACLLADYTAPSRANFTLWWSGMFKDGHDRAALSSMLIMDVPRQDASEVLWDYIWKLGRADLGNPTILGNLNNGVVRELVARGADINYARPRWVDTDVTDTPVLHALCHLFVAKLAEFPPMLAEPHSSCLTPEITVATRQTHLVRFLVEGGADPDIKVDGRSAGDILMGYARTEGVSQPVVDHLHDLCRDLSPL